MWLSEARTGLCWGKISTEGQSTNLNIISVQYSNFIWTHIFLT